jgi:hypothetical protein
MSRSNGRRESDADEASLLPMEGKPLEGAKNPVRVSGMKQGRKACRGANRREVEKA